MPAPRLQEDYLASIGMASCNQAAHSAFAMCGSPCAVRHVPFATPWSEGRGVLLEGHPATANRPPALSV
ncbi:hypothetical protein HZH68_003953 [Vespula germanica]|uniref:Uncharacterized protein n=1 Tax=Vespula germanica TaxID=30212 RepID=A0A834KPA5_VESGE|nr:hypothetical protein HZH68_003953 [Vespula germanica]